METGKYIVLNESNIIIFDATLSHKEVAASFSSNTITSAGHIVTDVDPKTNEVRIQCYGKSITLDIVSNPEADAQLAKFAVGAF